MYASKIIKVNATRSTNDKVKMLIKSKKIKSGDIIVAKYQYKGRGQHTNKWYSSHGKNLLCSMLYRHLDLNINQVFSINQVVSLAVLKTIRKFNKEKCLIKWPNDILSVNKKISGILIENLYRGRKLMGSIIGIGINVNQKTFPKNFNAISMKTITSRTFSLKKLLYNFLKIFNENLLLYRDYDLLISDFNDSLYRKNQLIEYEINGNIKKGKIIGLNDKERFHILNLSGVKETPKISDVKIIY